MTTGKKEQIAAVFSRAAGTYGRVGPDFFSYFGRRLVRLTDVRPGTTVLDVATGAGAILLATAQRTGPGGHVIGIDLAKGMVARLREEIGRRGLRNVDVCLMDAEELAFDDATFDYVLCGFALDSFPNPDRALSEFLRAIRPGGHIGLSISSGWWWEGDERWQWHGELLKSLGVQIDSGPRRFATSADVVDNLNGTGFIDAFAVSEEFLLVFADAGEWWQWAWSHGYRRVLEAMGAAVLEHYRATCHEQLTGAAKTGGIRGRLQVLLAVAGKPAM